jgi:hypothetical protein
MILNGLFCHPVRHRSHGEPVDLLDDSVALLFILSILGFVVAFFALIHLVFVVPHRIKLVRLVIGASDIFEIVFLHSILI